METKDLPHLVYELVATLKRTVFLVVLWGFQALGQYTLKWVRMPHLKDAHEVWTGKAEQAPCLWGQIYFQAE